MEIVSFLSIAMEKETFHAGEIARRNKESKNNNKTKKNKETIGKWLPYYICVNVGNGILWKKKQIQTK